MALYDDIRTLIDRSELGTQWTAADLINSEPLSRAYQLTTLQTAPYNDSISAPGLSLGTGAAATPRRFSCYRVGRRQRAILFSLPNHVGVSTMQEVLTGDRSLPAMVQADDTQPEYIVEDDTPAATASESSTDLRLTSQALHYLERFVATLQAARPWPVRLQEYQWRGRDFEQTQTDLRHLLWQGSIFSRMISGEISFTERDDGELVDWAQRVFEWGGTKQQRPVTAEGIKKTIKNATANSLQSLDAPMNSGYTKLASFATDYLESVPDGIPQVINDSRVAASLTRRLEAILLAAGEDDPARHFGNLGHVDSAARTGELRFVPLTLPWPNAYRSWAGQFAATQVVCEIRNLLNARAAGNDSYRLDGRFWTVRSVEAVLFSDGY